MPNAIQTPAPTGKIVFELERFEYDGERLALSGRWFGVRGRRFVRPTLTLLGGSERSRALADLEHKPWAAEDGEPWEAAFPWAREGRSAKFELSVAPDISVELPSPGAKRTTRRIAALPRADATFSSTSTLPTWDAPEPVEPRAPLRDPELERLETELRAAKAERDAAAEELEASRTALSERERELEAVREQLAVSRADRESAANETTEVNAARNHMAAERDQLMAERAQLTAQLDQLQSHHDALASDRAQVITERDQLMIEHEKLVTELNQGKAERDQLTAQMRQMAGEHDQTRQGLAKLQSQLDQASVALKAANRERDEAVTARGAALVMRHAAGTPPHYERPSSWWKQTLAVLALIGVIFAILIVAHVL